MKKFKKGDIVKLRNNSGMSAEIGAKAEVIRYSKRYAYLFGESGPQRLVYLHIRWLNETKHLSHIQMDGGYEEEAFELDKPQSQYEKMKEQGIIK